MATRLLLIAVTPEAVYVVTNLDIAGTTEKTGRDLMDAGLAIVIQEPSASALFAYQKKL